jgi:hypothetical protein
LIKRFLTNAYSAPKPTIGLVFEGMVELNDSILDIYDSGGQDGQFEANGTLLRNTHCVILTFSLLAESSLTKLTHYLTAFRKYLDKSQW